MYTDVYVGEFSEHVWDGWSSISNQPKGVTSFFPEPVSTPERFGGYQPFCDVKDRIKDGIYEGRQLDWGCWAAKVTKKDLLLLMDEYYPEDWLNSESAKFVNRGKFAAELKKEIANLDENAMYLLTALES